MKKRILQVFVLLMGICFFLIYKGKEETEYSLGMIAGEKDAAVVQEAETFDHMEDEEAESHDEQAAGERMADTSLEGKLDYSQVTEDFCLDYEMLVDYQSGRKISDAISPGILPEELVQLLKAEALQEMKLGGDTQDFWEEYRAKDKLITYQEMLDWLGMSQEEAEERYWAKERITACLIDTDEDGNEELLQCIDLGGSLRLADIYLWQKRGGEPVVSDSAEYVWARNDIPIFLQGKFYQIRSSISFFTHEIQGNNIYAFEQGGKLKHYYFQFANPGQEKDWFQTYVNEAADTGLTWEIQEYLGMIRQELEKNLNSRGYGVFNGTVELETDQWKEASVYKSLLMEEYGCSEQELEDFRQTDFDNDGEMEIFKKWIWYPTSSNASMALLTSLIRKEQTSLVEYDLILPENFDHSFFSGRGFWAQEAQAGLWFENFHGKVYTFDLRRLDFNGDYILDVSLIEGKKLTPILQYVLIDQKEFGLSEVEES